MRRLAQQPAPRDAETMTALEVQPQPTAPLAPEIAPLDCTRHAKLDDDGLTRLHLLVDGIHCGGCIRRIETALQRQPGVREARVNMSTGRLVVAWAGSATGTGTGAGMGEAGAALGTTPRERRRSNASWLWRLSISDSRVRI